MPSREIITLINDKIMSLSGTTEAVFEVSIPEEKFGDFSTNAALVLAKQITPKTDRKISPLELAQQWVGELETDSDFAGNFSKIEAVAPGFINFTLADSYLLQVLNFINKHPDIYGSSEVGEGKLALVEYFQLNTAKPPHVGHLRSAIIGDSIKRLFASQGYKTVSDTHIGDWGTQFGILLWAYKNLGGREKVKADPLNELNNLYVEANKLMEDKDEILSEAKKEFVKLEQGDKENRKLWEFFVEVSKREFDEMVKRLELLPFEYDLGESFYEQLMKDALSRLERKSLLQTGAEGEKYVDLEEHNLGRFIVVKSDGGTTYGLRDLATMFYRYEVLPKKERSVLSTDLYVVDNRQSHHFNQLFKVFALLGEHDPALSRHVDYGHMKLPEGAFSTRKGTVVQMEKLLDEAEARALEIIKEKNPGLKDKNKTARAVALGALKYADLLHNRKGDLVFRWDEALNFDGNTGPYLQYTHARLRSILRKSNFKIRKLDVLKGQRDASGERLLRKLIHFPAIVENAAHDLSPNILTNYLYELSGAANHFYQSSPVLAETNEELRELRLAIVSACADVLKNGLYLLGIQAPEEM